MTTTIGERVEQVLPGASYPVQTALREIVKRRKTEGLEALMSRSGEFDTPLRAMLVGVLMDPEARKLFDARLDIEFNETRATFNRQFGEYGIQVVPEVVVGAGVHAAVYCAARAAKAKREGVRFSPPLVVEARERVGGAFAVTSRPSFYLNSRNRAGAQGAPGEGGALNFLPGAPVQPYDITNTEYQTNASIADVVRVTLAMYGRVLPRKRVSAIFCETPFRQSHGQFELELSSGVTTIRKARAIRAKRVIVATGLGAEGTVFPSATLSADYSGRVLSYMQFLRRMDTPFPLRGLGRVAVIGGGDSGRTVIEALFGQGPQPGMSTLALDRMDRVDWYGPGAQNEETWCQANRGRYRRIGRLFRNDNGGRAVNTRKKASSFGISGDTVYVDGVPYDHVIVATGWSRDDIAFAGVMDYRNRGFVVGARNVAREANNGYWRPGDFDGIFTVGPASEIPADALEQALPAFTRLPENTTSIFRYAPRTAALAAALPF